MPTVEALARALVEDRAFAPLPAAELAARGVQVPEGFDFLGAKDHWGSVMTVGVLRADGIGAEALAQRAAAFHALVEAQSAFTGSLVIQPRIGRAQSVELGSFGLLLLVCQGGASDALVAQARALKQGELRAKRFSVLWVVDAPLRKVHAHKGLPLAGLDPPRRWVEQALG